MGPFSTERRDGEGPLDLFWDPFWGLTQTQSEFQILFDETNSESRLPNIQHSEFDVLNLYYLRISNGLIDIAQVNVLSAYPQPKVLRACIR